MKIDITLADAQKAKGYFDRRDCLVGTALKRQFPESDILVGGSGFRKDGQFYTFTNLDQADKVQNAYIAVLTTDGNVIDIENFKPFSLSAKKTNEDTVWGDD